MINFTQIFGIIASILSATLFIPQLVHMIKLKSGKDVSYIFLFLQIIASIMWVLYGYFINSLPLILCDSFMFLITIMMIVVKYKFSFNENLEI
jgi:MtN3 and saliva related transmembrane protein